MLLGLDFGLKNIGIAITDDEEKIALAYDSVRNRYSLHKIEKIIISRNIKSVVIGYPVKDNEEGFVAQQARLYGKQLEHEFGLEIFLYNEFYTTQLAIQNLREQGYSPKSVEQKKDAEAARIILQTYLDNMVQNTN